MNNQRSTLSETVEVVAIEGPYAWVETQGKSACKTCSSKQGCGTGTMADYLTQNKMMRLKIRNDFQARLREKIVIEWNGDSFLTVVARTYLMPSFLCVFFACLGGLSSDGMSALGALAGMGLGMVINAFWAKNNNLNNNFEIVFLHRVKE
jgi:sigma-E factor negative regulatory protein RseC